MNITKGHNQCWSAYSRARDTQTSEGEKMLLKNFEFRFFISA